jgi:polyphosphate kinase 2 (PPK2 family)
MTLTSTIPWILVPADNKYYRNHFMANTIVETLEN